MFNKTDKAIIVLHNKKTALDNINNVNEGNTWKTSLRASFQLYLGNDSPFLNRLDSLYFTRKVQTGAKGYLGAVTENIFDHNLKNNFKSLLDNAIEHVKSHGLYKNPLRNNFLSNYNNTQILSGAFILAGIIFGSGVFKGKLDTDREIIECNNRNSELTKEVAQIKETNQNLKTKVDSLKTSKTSP
jgi:hypothetical protein